MYKFYTKDTFSTRILYYIAQISLVWRAIAKSFWPFTRMHYIMYKYLLHLDDNNVDGNNIGTVAAAIVLVQIVSHQWERWVGKELDWYLNAIDWMQGFKVLHLLILWKINDATVLVFPLSLLVFLICIIMHKISICMDIIN